MPKVTPNNDKDFNVDWLFLRFTFQRGGMESNSSSGMTRSPVRIRLCEHNEQAVLHTSWTDKNPGRRFFRCPYWYPGALQTGGAHCDYFDWLDGPIGEEEKLVLRSQRDIRSLKQRIVEYETKMEEIEMKCKEYGRKIEKCEKKNKEYGRRIEECEKKNKELEANMRKSNGLMWAAWVACSILIVILLAMMGTYSRPGTKYLRLPHSRSG